MYISQVGAMTKLAYDNVFDAIAGSPQESADLQFRADMMLVLRSIFESKGMTQDEIGSALGIPQPRVSELMRGKVEKVSADKLIRYLASVGYRIQPLFVRSRGRAVPLRCDVIRESGKRFART